MCLCNTGLFVQFSVMLVSFFIFPVYTRSDWIAFLPNLLLLVARISSFSLVLTAEIHHPSISASVCNLSLFSSLEILYSYLSLHIK